MSALTDLRRGLTRPRIVIIDPNVRTADGLTFTGTENAPADIRVGEQVDALEIESHVVWRAEVTDVDAFARLIHLRVDWQSGKDW